MTQITVGTKIFDFATARYATVEEISTYEDEEIIHTSYILDSTVPLSEEYPTTARSRFEIGLSPSDEHGTIYTARTILKTTGKDSIEINEPTLN